MKIHEQCLPCLVNQAVRTADMLRIENREEMYRQIFLNMSRMDMNRTNPELVGENFRIIKAFCGCDDPYRETKAHYNRVFMDQAAVYEKTITSFREAVKYAIVANIIDFNPIHGDVEGDIRKFFGGMEALQLAVDHTAQLQQDISRSKTILYLGDNCGEICFDKLLIRRIRKLNPEAKIYFGVRGEAVVNDNTMEDALFVRMDEEATVISNGDWALGTVLERVSPAFRKVYDEADVVIAKGQANFESLSEEEKNIYFLLVVKCPVIARCTKAPQKSLVCMKQARDIIPGPDLRSGCVCKQAVSA